MKFTNIRKSDACDVRSIKCNLDAAVSRLCIEQMLSMKEHTTTNREIISWKMLFKNPWISPYKQFA